MPTRKELGDQGEQQALVFLQQQGLTLLERNFRCVGGEIDLVMRDDAVLVLVEVRLRHADDYGGAAASVTATKQRRLIVAASKLLQQRPAYRRYRMRFDLIALTSLQGTPQWIKDAFRC